MKLPEGLLEVNAPLTAEEKQQQAQASEEKALTTEVHGGSQRQKSSAVLWVKVLDPR
jgi:hypothetical protein